MPHRDPHHRSDPESTFDTWLDALVAGTPAHVASQDDPSGPLARAQAGARQLHGLAAQAAMPGTAVQQRIREDLMQSGALAAGGGRRWKPERRRERRVPWWSPTSPVLATALAIAVIVALVASLFVAQRPVNSPGTSDAPGFAVASPEASPGLEDESGTDLLVIRGLPADEARALHDHVGVLDSDGLTIYRPNTDPIAVPGVNEVIPFGVPGQAMATWMDASRAVIDLASGETLHELPDVVERESFAFPYLFRTESSENADWTIFDVRTGESRALSEIVELPVDQPAIPVQSGPLDGRFSPNVYLHFVTPEYEVSPTSDIPRFVVAGSLDRAMTLDGYPPATQAVGHHPVVAPDGESVAWITSEPESTLVVADTASSDEKVRIDLDEVTFATRLAGFTADGQSLVMATTDRIILLSWADGEPEQQVVTEGFADIGNPLLHAPSGSLYIIEDLTIKRVTIPDGTVTVVDPDLSSRSMTFTGPDAPWIVAGVGGNAAMIDARTGEIVSQLSDVPPNEAEFDAVSFSTSFNGSVYVQEIGGSHSGYLLSPKYPNGLVLTAPIDPNIVAASGAPDGIPVKYNLSADGTTVVAGTVGDDGYTPHYLAQVGPEPEWTPIAPGAKNLYWLPMVDPKTDEPDIQTLPAQEFATPFATPASEELSCSAPGYRPAIRSEVDPESLATIGGGEPIRFNGETTIIAANGTEITFDEETAWTVYPGNDRVLVSGASENEMHTATSLATGESWTFPPPHEDAMEGSTTFMVVGQWLIGPTIDDDSDMLIVNTETGQERLVSDILGRELTERGQPLIAPWSDRTTAPTIMAFMVTERPTPSLVLPSGDLNDAYPLADEHTLAAGSGVITSDGSRIAYFTIGGDRMVRVLDGFTGELISEHPAPKTTGTLETIGLTGDETKLVLRDDRHVWTVDLENGELATAFESEETIFSFEFDHTTGTALASTGVGRPETPVWLNPVTGETKELEISLSMRLPNPQFGWALIQTSDEDNVDYTLLDMTTGELAMEPVVTDGEASPGGTWIVGDSPDSAGVYVVRNEPGTMLVLDGPGGRSFELTTPVEESRTSGVAIGVSPNRECIVYTQPGSGDDPGASWVAPLEPDAGWTELPFELSGWLEMPTPSDEAKAEPSQESEIPTPSATTTAVPTVTPFAIETPLTEPPSEETHVTSIAVTAIDTISVSIIVDGEPVFDGELDAGDTTPYVTGSVFEVMTSSGTNTQIFTTCSDIPFNMGYEPGEAYYILQADEYSCAPIASPAASPTSTTTSQNGTTEKTEDTATLQQLIPDGMVPVMSPEPWDILDRSEAGGIGESGLTIPLGNGETYRLPDGRRVTQISPTSIALVEHHDGTRLTIDLDTGETLAELPERSDEERIIGLYRFAPVDEEQTAWTITDLRDGTETDTTVIGDGPFNDAVQVIPMLYSFDALDRLVIQFVTETSVGDTIPWQGLSTDEGPVSGTLVIPGSLDDARFLDTMAGRIDPLTPAVAISTGDTPLLAYARTGDSDAAIVLEDAVTGEEIATWSARDLQQRTSSIYFAGFSDDGRSLIAWVGEGGYGPDFVHRLTWDGGADIADSIELPFEQGSIDLVIGTGPSVLVLTSDGSSQPQRWKLADFDNGEWQDLPHLDGYQARHVRSDSPWVAMGSPDGTADQPVIVDRRTGEIAASTEYPQDGLASSDRRSLDLSVVVLTSFDGSGGTTGYVVDARSGESWEISPPDRDGMAAPNVTYDVSPDGSILVAKSQEAAPDGVVETWISPVQPKPEWVSIGQRTISDWLVYPDD